MSVDQIKSALANMPEAEQDQVVAFVVHLRHLRDPEFRRDLARKIDDQDPAHWISLDQLEERWKI